MVFAAVATWATAELDWVADCQKASSYFELLKWLAKAVPFRKIMRQSSFPAASEVGLWSCLEACRADRLWRQFTL